MYSVICPNKYPDVIAPLVRSIHQKIPNIPAVIVIADGHENDYGFRKILYDDPHFVYSRAMNLGIRATSGDLILLNDDCKLLEWNFFDRLAQFAYAKPEIGILSPLIMGCVGNPVQRWHERNQRWRPDMDFIDVREPDPVCFPCVYIKRKVFDDAGLMDEAIAGYGYDDLKMCQVARAAGWKTMVTQRITIQHADGSAALGEGRGKSWATSYMRRWEGGAPPGPEIIDYLNRRIKKGSV